MFLVYLSEQDMSVVTIARIQTQLSELESEVAALQSSVSILLATIRLVEGQAGPRGAPGRPGRPGKDGSCTCKCCLQGSCASTSQAS